MLPAHRMLVATLITGLLLCPAIAQQPATPCTQSTVESNSSPAYARQAKAFLVKLQQAVQSEDRKQMASLVQYPLRINGLPHVRSIRNRTAFLRLYSTLFNDHMRQVLRSQSPDCLFHNWQGAMIGSGELWFDQTGAAADAPFRITAINYQK